MGDFRVEDSTSLRGKCQIPMQDLAVVDVREREDELQMDVHDLILREASSISSRALKSFQVVLVLDGTSSHRGELKYFKHKYS